MHNRETLKKIYAQTDIAISEINNYLEDRQYEAYSQSEDLIYHLSNPVLSRSPNRCKLLHKFLFPSPPSNNSFIKVAQAILINYRRSLILFLLFVIRGIHLRKVQSKDLLQLLRTDDDLYLVDTFVVIPNTVKKKEFRDQHFGDLLTTLERQGKKFLFLPVFLGRWRDWNELKALSSILSNSKYDFVTETCLLTFFDYWLLLRFILLYPLKTTKLFPKSSTQLSTLFKGELVDTLSDPQVLNYARYLQGKRLSSITKGKLKIISWYENQPGDKNLIRGLRDGSTNCRIYGCQLFVYSSSQMNICPTLSEEKFRLIPDRLLVNGKTYKKRLEHLNTDTVIGPSLRDKHVFQEKLPLHSRNCVSICLSYLKSEKYSVLNQCILSTALIQKSVAIKYHPADPEIAFRLNQFQVLSFPEKWVFTNNDISDVISSSALVITSESGTAVEAVACGTSVLIVANQSTFTSNPMIDIGRGTIWDIAFDPDEITELVEHLLTMRKESLSRIHNFQMDFREICFNKPTDDLIASCFDLRLRC